jgi:transcription elongation factor Elf1
VADFDKDFIKTARFACKACGKECKLTNGQLKAENEKTFAVGHCSECGRPQRFDVTNAWREEE